MHSLFKIHSVWSDIFVPIQSTPPTTLKFLFDPFPRVPSQRNSLLPSRNVSLRNLSASQWMMQGTTCLPPSQSSWSWRGEWEWSKVTGYRVCTSRCWSRKHQLSSWSWGTSSSSGHNNCRFGSPFYLHAAAKPTVAYVVWTIYFKSEVKSDLWGCLEAIVASKLFLGWSPIHGSSKPFNSEPISLKCIKKILKHFATSQQISLKFHKDHQKSQHVCYGFLYWFDFA